MTEAHFKEYLAACYGGQPDDPRTKRATQMAVESFGGKYPWSWARQEATYTTDANGKITFDDDFDGTITVRERKSSQGGWIYVWSPEKFDSELPRLDQLSGTYLKACKIQKIDGIWQAQMAPVLANETVYVLYKRLITSINEVPNKHLDCLAAVAHSLMVTPKDREYALAKGVAKEEIKDAWKKDRKNWAQIFKTYNEGNVREYVRWWGVHAW